MPPKACTKGIASCTSGAGGLRGFWLWASYTSHALFDIIAVRLLFKGHDKHIEQGMDVMIVSRLEKIVCLPKCGRVDIANDGLNPFCRGLYWH